MLLVKCSDCQCILSENEIQLYSKEILLNGDSEPKCKNCSKILLKG